MWNRHLGRSPAMPVVVGLLACVFPRRRLLARSGNGTRRRNTHTAARLRRILTGFPCSAPVGPQRHGIQKNIAPGLPGATDFLAAQISASSVFWLACLGAEAPAPVLRLPSFPVTGSRRKSTDSHAYSNGYAPDWTAKTAERLCRPPDFLITAPAANGSHHG